MIGCYTLYREPPKAAPMKVFETWHRAFHGTVKDSLKGILQVGEIVPAGEDMSRPILRRLDDVGCKNNMTLFYGHRFES